MERTQCPDLLLAACMLSSDATVAALRALASTIKCKPAVHSAIKYCLGDHHLDRATFSYLCMSSALCVTPCRLRNQMRPAARGSIGNL